MPDPEVRPRMRVEAHGRARFRLTAYWSSLFGHFGLKRSVLWAVESLLNMILSPLPIVGGSALRALAFKPLFRHRGRGFMTSPGVRLLHCYNISVGDRCSLNYDTTLNGRGGLSIGDDFTTGPGVIVWTVKHEFMDSTKKVLEQGEYDAPVSIGNDVWCGARAVIMPGVKVADGAVIGAGAVVTHDTEPYAIMAGNPARAIGRRTPGGQGRVGHERH